MKTAYAVALSSLVTAGAGTLTYVASDDASISLGVSTGIAIVSFGLTLFSTLTQPRVQSEEDARAAQGKILQGGIENQRVTRGDGAFTRETMRDLGQRLPEETAKAVVDEWERRGYYLATRKTKTIADRLPEETARAVVDEWERRGHHSATLKAETIISLARRLPDGGGDLDALVKGLIRALDAAEDLVERGQRSSNLDKFADDVFRVIAERIEADDFDGAADTANAGFEDWKKREAERAEASRQTGLSLLEATIEAETARSNAAGIARAECRRLALMEGHVSFQALRSKQHKYYANGQEQGVRLDLETSVELARIAIDLASDADERGAALNDLGISLVTLGERGDDDALHDAIAVYRNALKEYTRARAPLDWAMTQNNLGNALAILGERGDDDALHDAITTYRNALKEYTRARAPLDWAMTQNNLGTALQTLGERGDDAALHDAIAAYRNALKERTRERIPLKWAMTQNNLGNALATLGERGDDNALHDAITAYREALKEYTSERIPLEWAATQNNLGNALLSLGARGDDAALHDAIAAYRDALQERTRERVPLDWAMTQNNLGEALRILGERGDDDALERAREACKLALEEWTIDRTPHNHQIASRNLASAEALLKERRNDAD
nr:tetratricopeptide repeat protein [uncultured Hyphomonas sp.]